MSDANTTTQAAVQTETKPAVVTETKPAVTTETKSATTEAKAAETTVEKPSVEAPEPIIGQTKADKTAEETAAEAAKAPVTDPAKYTEFKMPEGFEADEAVLGEAKKVFAESGLSQDAAQRMIDFHTKQLGAVADQPYQLWADTQKEWQDEVNADAEIGGKNLPAVKATIAKALDAYGDKGVLEALSFTGAGNNPAIIKTFYKMAKALTEGKIISGGPKAAPKTMAEAMYPNMPAKG